MSEKKWLERDREKCAKGTNLERHAFLVRDRKGQDPKAMKTYTSLKDAQTYKEK